MHFDECLQRGEVGFVFLFGEDVVGRIADDGVEAGVGKAAFVVVKDVGEFDFPVEGGDGAGGGESGLEGGGVADGGVGFGGAKRVDEGAVIGGGDVGGFGREIRGNPDVGNLAEGGAFGFDGFEEDFFFFFIADCKVFIRDYFLSILTYNFVT